VRSDRSQPQTPRDVKSLKTASSAASKRLPMLWTRATQDWASFVAVALTLALMSATLLPATLVSAGTASRTRAATSCTRRAIMRKKWYMMITMRRFAVRAPTTAL
jgi:hypothetical protein